MSYKISEPTMWFFKTVDEVNSGGVPRMRPLEGQFIPDEKGGWEPMDPTLNVQSTSKPRSENPVGTIFVSKSAKKATSSAGTQHYMTGEKDIIAMNRGVTSDIQDAYNIYMASVGAPLPDEEEPSVAPKPVGSSFLDKLLAANPLPTVAKDGFYVHEDVWSALLFNVSKGYNTMLVGESGTGKTELTQLLAKALEKSIEIFDMGAKQDPIASLIGVHRFEDNKSVFDRADFTFAIEKPGIVVLDELPRAPVNTNNVLFPVLDSRRVLNMDVASHELRSIKVHEECCFIATANEGFRYTGNNVLDSALKERFQIVLVEFMPENHEVNLLKTRTGVDTKTAQIIVKTAKTIRAKAAADELTMGVSVRHTLYASDLAHSGMTLAKALAQAFLPMYVREEERKIVKDILAAR